MTVRKGVTLHTSSAPRALSDWVRPHGGQAIQTQRSGKPGGGGGAQIQREVRLGFEGFGWEWDAEHSRHGYHKMRLGTSRQHELSANQGFTESTRPLNLTSRPSIPPSAAKASSHPARCSDSPVRLPPREILKVVCKNQASKLCSPLQVFTMAKPPEKPSGQQQRLC